MDSWTHEQGTFVIYSKKKNMWFTQNSEEASL